MRFVAPSDVSRIVSAESGVVVHTASGRVRVARAPARAGSKRGSRPGAFVRAHRSTLVNAQADRGAPVARGRRVRDRARRRGRGAAASRGLSASSWRPSKRSLDAASSHPQRFAAGSRTARLFAPRENRRGTSVSAVRRRRHRLRASPAPSSLAPAQAHPPRARSVLVARSGGGDRGLQGRREHRRGLTSSYMVRRLRAEHAVSTSTSSSRTGSCFFFDSPEKDPPAPGDDRDRLGPLPVPSELPARASVPRGATSCR